MAFVCNCVLANIIKGWACPEKIPKCQLALFDIFSNFICNIDVQKDIICQKRNKYLLGNICGQSKCCYEVGEEESTLNTCINCFKNTKIDVKLGYFANH